MRTKQIYQRNRPIFNRDARKASYVAKKTSAKAAALAALRAAGLQGYARVGGNYGRYGYSAKRAGFAPELKFFDTSIGGTVDNTMEVIQTSLALIPQDDTQSGRDGRLAVIKSIQVRGVLEFNPAATDGMANVWFYVVLDTQANGAAPAVTDIFTSTAAGQNLINLNNSGRFRILKKLCYTFNPTAGIVGAFGGKSAVVDFYIPCNIKMDWSSTTGAITEIRSNNILMVAGADVNGAADDLVAYEFNSRVRFIG